jgi:hypothetical protein
MRSHKLHKNGPCCDKSYGCSTVYMKEILFHKHHTSVPVVHLSISLKTLYGKSCNYLNSSLLQTTLVNVSSSVQGNKEETLVTTVCKETTNSLSKSTFTASAFYLSWEWKCEFIFRDWFEVGAAGHNLASIWRPWGQALLWASIPKISDLIFNLLLSLSPVPLAR